MRLDVFARAYGYARGDGVRCCDGIAGRVRFGGCVRFSDGVCDRVGLRAGARDGIGDRVRGDHDVVCAEGC